MAAQLALPVAFEAVNANHVILAWMRHQANADFANNANLVSALRFFAHVHQVLTVQDASLRAILHCVRTAQRANTRPSLVKARARCASPAVLRACEVHDSV